MTGTPAAAVALAVYLVGLATAFGWRTVALWRATGNTGYRGISGRPGSLHWWGGVLFAVALALGVAAPVLALAGVTRGPEELRHPVAAGAGLVVAVAGVLVTLAAQRDMGASWRIGVDPAERTALVTGGLFAPTSGTRSSPARSPSPPAWSGWCPPRSVSSRWCACSPRCRSRSAPSRSPTSSPPTARTTGTTPPGPAGSFPASAASRRSRDSDRSTNFLRRADLDSRAD